MMSSYSEPLSAAENTLMTLTNRFTTVIRTAPDGRSEPSVRVLVAVAAAQGRRPGPPASLRPPCSARGPDRPQSRPPAHPIVHPPSLSASCR